MQATAPLLQLEKPGGFVALDETLLTGQAGLCDLFALFTPRSAAFALRERSSQRFLAAETILSSEKHPVNGPTFIRESLKESQVFRLNAHRKSTVAVANPFATLLPSGLVRNGDEQSLLQLSISRDDLVAGSSRVSGFDLQVVFGLPPEEESLLRQLIPGCTLTHSLTAALEFGWLAYSSFKTPVLQLITHPGLSTVLVSAGKKLLLANTFPVADTEESAYYILNVCEQLELDRTTVEVVVSGSPVSTDALSERLSGYFNRLRTADTRSFQQLSYKLKDLPSATLLPILTLSLCES